jgi:PAS domain S-box-containing protein
MPTELNLDHNPSIQDRIRELELRLEEAEETLGAIRRGEIDAVVINDKPGDPRVYTLESADRPYQILIEQMQEGAVSLQADGTVVYCNRRMAQMLSVPQERMIGRKVQDFLFPDDANNFENLLKVATRSGARRDLTLRAADGGAVPVNVSLNILHSNGLRLLCGVLTDLTEQKVHLQQLADANTQLENAIAERERVEDALRQAQKMEAIGQLTGGIAHDFNNILQGITGGIALAQQRIASGRPEAATQMLELAQSAANRAATLTRRLLSFGRRQALDSKVVVVDELIGGMDGLIRRTVGPSVGVDLRMKDGCWPVMCDPNQLENALLNLSINARDALAPAGGRLVIETTHEVLDEADTGPWEGTTAGDFVRITVTDNGAGMPPDVLAHAFEPFFTTKPVGQGTGLGLSQIYGFMRQSHGLVRLESTPGVGTSVHLYLPRGQTEAHEASEIEVIEQQQSPARAAASATVLLVEDEPLIRTVAAEALRGFGYRVLVAEDSTAAVRVLHEAKRAPDGQNIRLLVTDVGLPRGLNGRQLADVARELNPDLPVLLITGYAGDAVTGAGQLGPGMALLPKPFSMEELKARIQAMIV